MPPSNDAARLESGAYRAALVAAAAAGDAATVRALADGSCPPDVSPATKASFLSVALLRAAQGGHLEAVKALTRVPDAREDACDAPRVDVSRANADGNTPLHMACERGDARCVDVLLALGANLAARNAEGKTPIAVARTGGIRAAVAAEVERRRDARRNQTPARARDDSRSARALPGGSANDANDAATIGARRSTSRTPSKAPSSSARVSAAATPASPGSAVIKQKLKDDLKCVVCLRDFCSDGEGSAPVTLPCGHNFCAECVGGMRGTGDEDARRAFRCPLDRTMFSRHLELRVNGAMRDLIGFMHSRVHGQALPGAPRHRSRLGECPGADERRRAARRRGCGPARAAPRGRTSGGRKTRMTRGDRDRDPRRHPAGLDRLARGSAQARGLGREARRDGGGARARRRGRERCDRSTVGARKYS